jgi:putative ABC transport system substrate-binding protein
LRSGALNELGGQLLIQTQNITLERTSGSRCSPSAAQRARWADDNGHDVNNDEYSGIVVTQLVIALGLLLFTISLPADAQQARTPWRIGYLAQASLQVGPDALGMFRSGLRELGYVEGQQYVMEVRDAGGQPERLQKFAAELVALRVDVIVAASTPPAVALMQVTRSIPIVTVAVADPVGSGLVQSLARPGGNVTGTALAFDEISHKWLELLTTVRGHLSRVAVLSNSTNQSMPILLGPLEASARALKVGLTVHDFTPVTPPDRVFAAVSTGRPDGLAVLPDAFIRTHGRAIAKLAIGLRVPAIYGNRPYVVDDGGLMSYGPDQRENSRRAATYVHKILTGAKPADLPIERPTRFELIINLKAAKAAGLAIPPSLLQRADHVVE